MDSTHRRRAEEAGKTAGPVAKYKGIFRDILDRRPSGTRRRLAEAIGKNRSFISQISNPGYTTPIPAEHVDRIMEVCHFSARERETFLAAYKSAHPRRLRRLRKSAPPAQTRTLELTVPDLGDPAANEAFDRVVEETAKRVARLIIDTHNR